jgi:photosystem II stability/assembly factor-like uncharacterized protein
LLPIGSGVKLRLVRRSAIAAAVTALLATGCGGQTHQTDHSNRIIKVSNVAKGFVLAWRPERFLPKGLAFSSARHGWLSLSGSRTLETRDGGRRWTPARSQTTATSQPSNNAEMAHSSRAPCNREAPGYGATSFWTSSDGYAVCGSQPGAGSQMKSLYASTDGGKTWRLRVSEQRLPLYGYVANLRFFDRNHGLLLTNRGGIYATDDGGLIWRKSFYNPGEGTIYWSWPDRRNGYVASWDDGVYVTHDLGRTWQRLLPALQPVGPISYSSPDAAIGAVAPSGPNGRDGGAILRSSDGGHSWKPWGRIRTSGAVWQLIRLSTRSVVALTSSWSDFGRLGLFRSDDGGRSWQALTAPKTGAETDASFVSLSFAGADGLLLDFDHGGLFATHDGGASWELIKKHPRLFSVLVLDEKHFLAVSRDVPCLYSSTDGGRSWECVEIGISTWGARPSQIAASDSRHIWIAAGDDALIRTTDGGKSWRGFSFPLGFVPTGLSFVSPSTGFTNLDDGSGRANQPTLMTRNGGRTWTLLPLTPARKN